MKALKEILAVATDARAAPKGPTLSLKNSEDDPDYEWSGTGEGSGNTEVTLEIGDEPSDMTASIVAESVDPMKFADDRRREGAACPEWDDVLMCLEVRISLSYHTRGLLVCDMAPLYLRPHAGPGGHPNEKNSAHDEAGLAALIAERLAERGFPASGPGVKDAIGKFVATAAAQERRMNARSALRIAKRTLTPSEIQDILAEGT